MNRRLLARTALVALAALAATSTLGPATAEPAAAATHPRLRVTQTVDPATYHHAGQVLTWTSVVTNAGNVDLSGLAVVDASTRLSARTCAPVALGGTLAAGASTTCTATDTITQADVDALATRNDAVTASATTAPGEQPVKASATATASADLAASPGLTLRATASPASVSRPGQPIAYAVLVRNKGNQTVRELVVSTALAGLSPLVCAPVAQGGTLAPGATTTCRATRTATADDLGGRVLTGVVKATARTKTAAVGAAVRVGVDVTTRAPVAPDQVAAVIDEGDPVVLGAARDAGPAEVGGPAIDPARTVLVGGGVTYRGTELYAGGLTWDVLPDGRVQVTPRTDASADSGSVTYRVYDLAGRSDTATLRVSVRPRAVGADDHALTKQGRPVTTTVLGDDDAGQTISGARAAFDPGSVRLTGVPYTEPDADPADGGRSLTVPGRGTFTVTAAGAVRFSPIGTYAGDAKADYVVSSSNGSTATATLVVTVLPVQPKVSGPETRVTTAGRAVTFPAASDDAAGDTAVPLVPSATVLLGPAAAEDGTSARTAAGTWLVQPDGTVRVEPALGYAGTSAITYAVVDANGTRAETTLTLTVRRGPAAGLTKAARPVGAGPVTLDPLAGDTSGQRLDGSAARFVAASLVLVAPVEGTGGVLSDDGRTLTVPGQGVWRVLPAGTVTFAPADGFVGAASTQSYSVRDDAGSAIVGRLVAAVVGTGPVATADFARTPAGSVVRLPGASDDVSGAAGLVPAATVFATDGQPGGSTRSADGKSLTVPGEGTWTLAGDGSATFAPLTPFSGTTAEVAYVVVDASRATSRAGLQVQVEPGPVAVPDEVRLGPGVGNVAMVPLTVNDRPGLGANATVGSIDVTSVAFPADGQAAGWTVRSPTVALHTAGDTDVFVTLDPATEVVTVERLGAPASTDLALRYTVRDSVVDAGGATVHRSASSSLLVHLQVPLPPTATDDHAVTTSPFEVSLPASLNDVPGDPSVPIATGRSYASFPTTGQPVGSVVNNESYPYATVTVPGQGVWSRWVEDAGPATFTPVPGFVGDTSPVRYTVVDVAGGSAVGTLTVTVLRGPTAHDDVARTPEGVRTTIDVVANDDPGLDADKTPATVDRTVLLLSGADRSGSKVSPSLDVVTVPGQGSYTVQRITGDIVFVPAPGFTGTAARLRFRVRVLARATSGFVHDAYLDSSLQVSVDPVRPMAGADTVATGVGRPVVVPVLDADTPGATAVPLVPASVRLRTTADLPAGTALFADTKTLVVPGRGVFLVAGDGEVTFVPLGTATGTLVVGYQVADANGTTSRSTLTVRVTG